jgi:hypothetical protein
MADMSIISVICVIAPIAFIIYAFRLLRPLGRYASAHSMKGERSIKKAGYIILAALLALIFWCYWVAHHIDHGDAPPFLSGKAAGVVADICDLTFYIAVALVLFITIRALYLRLTKPDSKHERDA